MGVDLERRADGREAVANSRVDALDAAQVDFSFDHHVHGVPLDAAMLNDRGNTIGQSTCQSGQHDFQRNRDAICGMEDFGIVGFDTKGLPSFVLLPKAESAARLLVL